MFEHMTQGIYIYRHSQQSYVPECPSGTAKVWDGYSLSYVVGNQRAHSQDLGKILTQSRP